MIRLHEHGSYNRVPSQNDSRSQDRRWRNHCSAANSSWRVNNFCFVPQDVRCRINSCLRENPQQHRNVGRCRCVTIMERFQEHGRGDWRCECSFFDVEVMEMELRSPSCASKSKPGSKVRGRKATKLFGESRPKRVHANPKGSRKSNLCFTGLPQASLWTMRRPLLFSMYYSGW